MNTILPLSRSGSCLLSNAALRADTISALEWPLRASRISAFLSIKYCSTGAIVEYLSDCAAAFGTRKPTVITSINIILAMILIILSVIITLSLVDGLIARYPFAVAAARSPL